MFVFSSKPLIRERYCPNCRAWVQARKPQMNAMGHAGLSIITCGLWLPFALIAAIGHGLTAGFRCPRCGARCRK